MAPAAHNPGMVNGAEVKTLLYAKIHKPRRAPDKPLGRKGMGTPFCPIRHRLATGGHSLSLQPRNGPRARPPPREGACRTLLLFLPLDSATEKAWAMWKFPWSARGTPVAKSLQLCPTLCDPTEGSPPGFSVPGILQARTVEWVAIPFSNACK